MKLSFLKGAPIAATLLLAGCITADLTAVYDPASVAWSLRSGTAGVAGEAFLRQNGGGIVTAAGETVFLCPDSAYGRQVDAALAGGLAVPTDDPIYAAYISACRTQTAGGDGDFTFTNLPAGTYSVGTSVTWSVASGAYGFPIPQGGYVYSMVTVAAGQTARVIVSR